MSYTADFDISHIVADVGESFTVSGVSKTISDYGDRKSTRLNSSHIPLSRMPSSA